MLNLTVILRRRMEFSNHFLRFNDFDIFQDKKLLINKILIDLTQIGMLEQSKINQDQLIYLI